MLHGTHHFPLQERVIYGKPAAEAVVAEVTALGVDRVYVMSTRSLSGDGGLAMRIAAALGPRCGGLYGGVTAHSPREAVIEGAARARAAKAQLLIAVGGGSVIDATKAMLLCLWHGLTTTDAMDPYRRGGAKASHLDQSRHPPGMEQRDPHACGADNLLRRRIHRRRGHHQQSAGRQGRLRPPAVRSANRAARPYRDPEHAAASCFFPPA